MSVHYLLDGYNAIYQIPRLASKKTLRDAREALVRILIAGNFTGSVRNQLTVVFDGKPDVWHETSSSQVKVIFATHQTADDLIKDIVDGAASKKSIYAVTDDKALAQSIRDRGSRTIGVKDFFATILQEARTSSRVRKNASVGEEKYISTTVACKINDELKEIWLK